MLNFIKLALANPFPQAQTDTTLKGALQLLFGVIGAIALIIIILSSIQMVLSGGEPEKVSRARQSIIYAAVGLAIVASAEIIVTFVIGKL